MTTQPDLFSSSYQPAAPQELHSTTIEEARQLTNEKFDTMPDAVMYWETEHANGNVSFTVKNRDRLIIYSQKFIA